MKHSDRLGNDDRSIAARNKLKHIHWIYGLEEYFNVVDDTHLDLFLSIKCAVMYGNKWDIRDLVLAEMKKDITDNQAEMYVNTILQALLIDDYVIPSHDILQYINHCIDDEFISRLTSWSAAWGEIDNLSDHFSRGQMLSKFWMLSELNKLNFDPASVVLYGGWYSTISYFILNNYDRIRALHSFDIDATIARAANEFNCTSHDVGIFKAVTADVTELQWDCNKLLHDGSELAVDLLINTSCEHMDDTWFDNIPIGNNTLIVLQTNDYFDNDQHTNCVVSVEEALNKYKMSEVLFSGEYNTDLYNRFMIIGRK